MNNKEIASSFSLLADLMEIHGENPFKIKSYQIGKKKLLNKGEVKEIKSGWEEKNKIK